MDLTSLLPMVDVDGFPVAKLFEAQTKRPMKEHVDLLRALEMRPDDVILVAYGKAGELVFFLFVCLFGWFFLIFIYLID